MESRNVRTGEMRLEAEIFVLWRAQTKESSDKAVSWGCIKQHR